MEKTNKIAFVVASLAHGGTERVVATMANYWSGQGHQVAIFILGRKEIPIAFHLDDKVSRFQLGLEGESTTVWSALMRNLGRIRKIRKSILQWAPDVVLTFGEAVNIVTVLALRGSKVRVVISERTNPFAHKIGWIWSGLRRLSYPLASALVVQTERARSFFTNVPAYRMFVIPNPLQFDLSGRDFEILPQNNRAKTVMTIGRLGKEKGHDLLLRAFSKVSKQNPEWTLEIWGDGTERKNLENLCKELRLGTSVMLQGITQKPLEEMKRADIFVLSSRFEGFPNVLVEAMALGKCVVSFDCANGPAEIIRPGIDGVLVPPENPDEMAAALTALINDGEKRSQLGAAAREVRGRYHLRIIMPMWEHVAFSNKSTAVNEMAS